MTQEQVRLAESDADAVNWKKFGPYLTERQWGTVREDYSHDGNAWNSVFHDAARSYAYRWGEEGLGGFSDDQQLLCLNVGVAWSRSTSCWIRACSTTTATSTCSWSTPRPAPKTCCCK
ncbi:MAG: hypothetical protein EOO56_30135 [Hymenobacter sp.]|nr:MAG: hypothetical protein EOO56_30135 [Hymenobacter sp.]